MHDLFAASELNIDGMIICKLNNLDEKVHVMLRRINHLSNKSQLNVQSSAADEDDAPCLPPGICLPADCVRGLSELHSKVTCDQDIRKKLVSYFDTLTKCHLKSYFRA